MKMSIKKIVLSIIAVISVILCILIIASFILVHNFFNSHPFSKTHWTPEIQKFVESELDVPLPDSVPVQYFFFETFMDYHSELLISVPYSDIPKYIPQGIKEDAPFDSKTEFLGYINSKKIDYSLKIKLKELEFYKKYSGTITDKRVHCEVLVLSPQDFESLPSSAPVDVLFYFFEF